MALRKLMEVSNDGQTAKVYRDVEWSEYRVKLVGHPNADYHTVDKMDAYKTAYAMVGLDPRKGYDHI